MALRGLLLYFSTCLVLVKISLVKTDVSDKLSKKLSSSWQIEDSISLVRIVGTGKVLKSQEMLQSDSSPLFYKDFEERNV